MKKQVILKLRVYIIIGFLLVTSGVVAQSASDFAIPLTDPSKRGKLKAHLNYGSITVKGTARKDVLVKYKSVEDGDEEDDHDHDEDHEKGEKSRDGLKKISGSGMDLEASENDNSVRVQSDSWNTKLNLEIEVPIGFDLDVQTYNDGDLVITNIQGAVELTNYNGEITALNVSGSVVATTYNGEIKVSFDKISEGTPMSYSTYNGDIDITFPAATKATFKMKTEQGEIYTGFDMNIVSSGPVQKKDVKSGTYRVVIDDWKKGDINGGGPEITIKNYNGDIYLRKK